MTSTATLTGPHLRTYTTIFQHPVSHNLEWRAVHSLLRRLGEVSEEPNGNLRVTRNGEVLVLHPPRTKDIAETEELMAVRHFLQRSEAAPVPGDSELHWLLVIDHHSARIFRSEISGSIPLRILPHEPEDFFRHAHHSKDFARGQEKPDPNSFFAPVAKALEAAGPVLIFGGGTGTSSEMDLFVAWLKRHHPKVAERIIGTLVVDEHHLTQDQLLAKARDYYSGIRTA